MFRFGVRAKFILVASLLLLVVFAITTFILVRDNTRRLQENLLNEAKAFASLATNPIGNSFIIYKDSGHSRIQEEIVRFTQNSPNITNVAVLGLDGQVLFTQKPGFEPQATPEQASSFESTLIYNDQGDLETIIAPLAEQFGLRRYAVAYEVSNEAIRTAQEQAIKSIALGSLIALLITIVTIYLLANRVLLMPLRKVSQEALAISAGHLDRQIRLEQKDEIGDVAAAVNKMATSLKQNIQELQDLDKMKTEFLTISSHNLRTPISIIRGFLENLRYQKLPKPAKEKIEVISANTSRLAALTEDILAVGQIESGREFIELEPHELNKFIEPMLYEYKFMVQGAGLELAQELTTDKLLVNMSPAHLRTAIWNLLDNALKFTKNGKITVNTSLANQQVKLSVTDTGAGISSEELPRLFTKFHRGTDIMAYNYEGMGIGLYITKLIIDRHGGQITVSSLPAKGSIFTIVLPLAKDSST